EQRAAGLVALIFLEHRGAEPCDRRGGSVDLGGATAFTDFLQPLSLGFDAGLNRRLLAPERDGDGARKPWPCAVGGEESAEVIIESSVPHLRRGKPTGDDGAALLIGLGFARDHRPARDQQACFIASILRAGFGQNALEGFAFAQIEQAAQCAGEIVEAPGETFKKPRALLRQRTQKLGEALLMCAL